MKSCAILINFHETSKTKGLVSFCLSINRFDRVILVNCNPSAAETAAFEVFSDNERFMLLTTARDLPYGSNFNIGIRAFLKSDIEFDVAFLFNSDILFTSECVDACLAFMEENEKCGICAPRMLNPNGTIAACCWDFPDYRALRRQCYYYSRQKDLFKYVERLNDPSPLRVDVIRASFMCCRRSFLQLSGGFFEKRESMYNEENFLSAQISKMGFEEYVLPSVSYIHNHFSKMTVHKNNVLNRKSRLLFAKYALLLPFHKRFYLFVHSFFGGVELHIIHLLVAIKHLIRNWWKSLYAEQKS